MAKIKNKTIYPIDNIISDTDIVIGSDGDKSFKTKNFLIKDLKSFILGYESDSDTTDGVGIIFYNLFTWLKYADDENGTNMSDSPIGKTHIGLAFNKPTQEESNDPADYFWNLIGGEISYIGADGKTYYIWTKYSNSADGSNMKDDPTGTTYIGLAYHKETPVESNDPADYEWSLYLNNGILQQPIWLYFWIKFADNADGTEGFSDNPAGKLFIGIAYDKLTPIESDDPADYVWNPIQGEQGYTGPDGKTYWTWVKYALSKTATELFDDPEGMTWMGIAVNKTTSTESNDYRDYNWSKLPTNVTYEQDNELKVVEIPISQITEFTEQALADWININGLEISEIENVIFTLVDDAISTPVLDNSIPLVLALTSKTDTTASFDWANLDTAIVNYELVYSSASTGEILDMGTSTSYTLQSLQNNTLYEVYVIAYDTLGNTKISNTIQFSLFVTDKPNIWVGTNTGDVTTTSIRVLYDIDTSFNADRYAFYRDGIKVYEGANTYFNNIGLLENTSYSFYVIAYNGVNASLQSDTLNVTTLQVVDPPLTKPILSNETSRTTSIRFNVTIPNAEISRVTAYQVQYRIFGDTQWNDIATQPLSILEIVGLQSSTLYQIRLRTTDGNVVSLYSDILEVSTLADTKAKVSLLLENYNLLTDAERANGYVGQLTVLDGKPNTDVTVLIDVDIQYLGNQYVGSIHFKNLNIVVTNSQQETLTLTLDANGKFEDIFELYSFQNGAIYTVTATLLTSVNGIDPQYSESVNIYTSQFTPEIV